MATQLQLRRGNTAQTAVFTGAIAEVTVDTDKKTIVVHDGTTPGGFALALASSVTGDTARVFDHANSAFDHANLAFNKANSANILAQTAFDSSNTANTWLQANIGAARIADSETSQANVGAGLISLNTSVTNAYQANVGAGLISLNTSVTNAYQANVGAGLLSVSSAYEANVGAARIADRATTEANVGAGLISVTNAYQANVGALRIDADNANTNLKNYSDSTFFAKTGGLISGNVEVTGNITPNSDVTWNLGSPSNRWHSLFVGPGSIDLGGTVISNSSGTLSISGASDLILSDSTTPGFIAISDKANAAFDQANNAYDFANTRFSSSGGTISGDVVITGNLVTSGNVTYINTTELNIGDNLIVLNNDVTGPPTQNAGIVVARGTSSNVSMLWVESVGKWQQTRDGLNYYDFAISTSELAEGTNLYYLDSRARDALGNSSPIGYNSTTGTISHLNSGVVSGYYGDNISVSSIQVNETGHIVSVTNTSIRIGSTTDVGLLGLIDSVSNTSTTGAATANSVKTALDLAQANTGAGLIAVTSAYQANVGAARIADRATTEANVGAGLIAVTSVYEANVGAARITDRATTEANVGSGLITVTSNYEANVGAARIADRATTEANVGAGLISVTNAYQANVGAARIADRATTEANVGAGLIAVTSAYQANVGEARIDLLGKIDLLSNGVYANTGSISIDLVSNVNSIYANIGAARIADTAAAQANVGAGLISLNTSVTNAYQANVGAGLISVTNAYQANVGDARIADRATTEANVGAGLISVTNAYQANVGAARISDTAAAQANVGAGLIALNTSVTNAYEANVGAGLISARSFTQNVYDSSNTKVSKNGDTISGDLTVTGNLVVAGNVTTISANNLIVEDNMFYLNSGSNVSNPDLGFAGNYNDGTYNHAGLFRDASDGIWKFFYNYSPEPDESPYIDTSHASFRIADLTANLVTNVITLRGLDPLDYSNTVQSTLQANVGAARIADTAAAQANVGAGLISLNTSITNAYQANVGSARLELLANTGAINLAKVERSGDIMTGPLTSSSTLTGSSLVSNTSITLNTNSLLTSTTQTTSNTSQFVLDLFSTSSYRSAKYFVQVTSSISYHVIELSLLHDGSSVYLVQYGEIKTGSSLATFDATIVGGQVQLLSTPTNASTTYKAMRTLIPV